MLKQLYNTIPADSSKGTRYDAFSMPEVVIKRPINCSHEGMHMLSNNTKQAQNVPKSVPRKFFVCTKF